MIQSLIVDVIGGISLPKSLYTISYIVVLGVIEMEKCAICDGVLNPLTYTFVYECWDNEGSHFFVATKEEIPPSIIANGWYRKIRVHMECTP